MVDRFRIGVIGSTHGLRGEMKVFPTTDEIRRFSDLDEVILSGKGAERVVPVRSVKYFKNTVILALEGVDSIDDARLLRGAELYVTREQALPLAEGEHFIPDLIGLRVETEEGQLVGTLVNVIQTGANDVYEVKPDKSFREDERSILLPVIPDCIRKVEPEEGLVTVRLMEGLLDL